MVTSKRLNKWFGLAVIALAWIVPTVAMAAEEGAEAAAGPWQATVGKAVAAGLAMGLSAIGAGYAQGKIGSAGAGALAERPDVSIWIITLQALPEVIVLLGFVSAILITG